MDYPLSPDAPDRRYVDSGVDGQEGTVVRAVQMNALHEEIINVILASGQQPDANNTGQMLAALSVLGSSSRNNAVINGGFQVWQRGTTHDVGSEPIYTADRWEVQADGSGGAGAGLVTQETDASAPNTLKGRWQYMRYQPQVQATAGGPAIRTKLEVLSQLSGHRLTLSFLARASAPTTATVEISSSINQVVSAIETQAVSISQGWEVRQITFDLPHLGPFNPGGIPDFLQIEIRLPEIGSDTFELGGVQLGIGSAAVDFVPRPFGLEYFLCRRYFQTSGEYGSTIQPATIGGSLRVQGRLVSIYASQQSFDQFQAERFMPEMRGRPTVSMFADFGVGGPGPAGFVSWASSNDVVAQIFGTQSDAIGRPVIVGGAPSARTDCKFRWTADAEL